MKKAYLLLEDGTIFEGYSMGISGTTIGETVFNTGMTGYQEVLTDASYYGQIVIQTYPLVGNYGINAEDAQSRKSWVKGYIVRECCDNPSNFRSKGNLNDYLKSENVIGLYGIDTRKLTRILRESGVMNGAITDDISKKEELIQKIKDYSIIDAVKAVTVEKSEQYLAENAKYNIALMDYGYKNNIMKSLKKRGCNVTILPALTPPQVIIAMKPDGIMLSNGPGDPAENVEVIEGLKVLFNSGIPIFGICLGHQLMALANGAKTSKLKYGHRGANHPVKDIAHNRTYITSQNHGYAVVANTMDNAIGEISHISMNDETVEGVRYKDMPVFTVQFHPEASPGPMDSEYLFDEFIEVVLEKKFIHDITNELGISD